MRSSLDTVDIRISRFMARAGLPALRYSLAIIFFWFGLLKPLGLSPAAGLIKLTVAWLPVFSPETWLHVIGWWEVAIGLTFLLPQTTRIAIALLALQMGGTFMPLVMLPEVTYQSGGAPFALTLEGQYIVKNLIIISATLVVGGTVRHRRATPSPTAA